MEKRRKFSSFVSLANFLDKTPIEDEAKELIADNIFPILSGLTDILARAVAKKIKPQQLEMTCRSIEMLVCRQIRDSGYDIKDVRVWKDFDEIFFTIRDYDITYPKTEATKMKKEFEEEFFNLYGIKIKFSLPTER